jgi:Na+-transporting methylmalonyl-CoA/oxaloacetate decarboxylase gamma subunit
MKPARTSDRGAGLIGTIGGVLVFLTLLTFAVQLLVNLYATSAVTAAAHDAAHVAASGKVDRTDPLAVVVAVQRAEDHARSVLGHYGDRVSFSWDIDDEWVRLTVVAHHPDLAIAGVASVFGLNQVERTIEVRVEQTR